MRPRRREEEDATGELEGAEGRDEDAGEELEDAAAGEGAEGRDEVDPTLSRSVWNDVLLKST